LLGLDGPPTTTVALVAQPTPAPPKPEDPGGRGPDFGKPGPVAFLVLVLFFIAVAFLIRSMTKHLKRVPASFDKPGDTPADKAEPTDAKSESNGEATGT